jgi:hypothetical protein
MAPRTGLDAVDKKLYLSLPGFESIFLGRLARAQSLYRLSQPSPSLPLGHLYFKHDENIQEVE